MAIYFGNNKVNPNGISKVLFGNDEVYTQGLVIYDHGAVEGYPVSAKNTTGNRCGAIQIANVDWTGYNAIKLTLGEDEGASLTVQIYAYDREYSSSMGGATYRIGSIDPTDFEEGTWSHNLTASRRTGFTLTEANQMLYQDFSTSIKASGGGVNKYYYIYKIELLKEAIS